MKKTKMVLFELPCFEDGEIKVGDEVRTREGYVFTISEINLRDSYPLKEEDGFHEWKINGSREHERSIHDLDIMEILEVKNEKK